MKRVKLETSGGGHVGHSTIPQFLQPPNVLLWGERVFAFHEDRGDVWVYREAFMVAVMQPVTM